jgi:hypothetical protein
LYLCSETNFTQIRHQEFESDEVAFLMIGNNATNAEKSLDGIREKRQKFVCLNDNMNHSNPSSKDVCNLYFTLFMDKMLFLGCQSFERIL